MKNKDRVIKYCVYIVLLTGLAIGIAVLFPQVRQMIIELAERMMHRKIPFHEKWTQQLLFYAIGGIFLIVFSYYCSLTAPGKMLVCKTKNEIRECLAEIDWRSLIKPVLIMSGVYLLGIISLIRANFLYIDDIMRTVYGYRKWYEWNRYVSEFFSTFIHADFHLTDISPLPQLIAILILAVSSVLLIYALNNKKITITGLLASVPIGLSPYMLGCLSYRFDAPYMALSVLAAIVPFLFYTSKKAFVFCSVVCLLIMCMTYQAASGIYILITLVLCFDDWNKKRKTNREVFLFLGRAVISFSMAMVFFRFFLMKPYDPPYGYASTSMLSLSQLFSGILTNIRTYMNTINSDFSFIWKALIGIIFCFFIAKSILTSAQNKIYSFFAAFILLCLLFFLSFGVYIVLEQPLFAPRAMYGFGVLLAIISIYIVYDFNKIAKILALSLSWSFLVFAFSYGNALADQKHYADFRIAILLQDLSALYPDKDKDENRITIQLKNTIGFTPSIRNIAKHNPVIYKLVPQILRQECEGGVESYIHVYYLQYDNYGLANMDNFQRAIEMGQPYVDFKTLDLPIVLKTYYHTIRSDGKRVLVELNDGYQ